jgi:UDP-glucose 4-epimerase
MRVLVTGGAGYIGSHVVKGLRAAGHRVVVYDNLSSGHAWAVQGCELVVGDLAAREQLAALFAARRFDAVLHFAAHIWVHESVRDPAKYYRNNVANALNLFELAARHGVAQLVFSSTAAVYGQPDLALIDEAAPLAPINPYGASKMMAERMLADIATADGLRYAILRYFNVAGADPEGRIGEATPDNHHLIKVACETALGRRPAMRLNGTDYPTPDGTCIRDYIHVEDLAQAHIDALDHLGKGGASTVLNCGYGHGLSVRAVIDAVRRISGVDFPVTEGPRRPGDPAMLVADNTRIRRVLGWQPRFDDLELIVGSAWAWEQRLQQMSATAGG